MTLSGQFDSGQLAVKDCFNYRKSYIAQKTCPSLFKQVCLNKKSWNFQTFFLKITDFSHDLVKPCVHVNLFDEGVVLQVIGGDEL